MYTDEYFQISCSAIYGDFPIKFSWLFRNETIIGSENIRIEFTKRGSMLSIESVSGDNAGVYTCIASNHAGATNTSTELIVKGLNKNLENILFILIFMIAIMITYFYMIFQTVAPKVSLVTTGTNPFYIDDFVQFICSANGDMPIKFEWGFNNESIGVLDNIKIDGTRRSSTLTIEAVTADNVGLYHCTATNKGGKETSSSELIVKGVLGFLLLI